jgi:hypothetical protein
MGYSQKDISSNDHFKRVNSFLSNNGTVFFWLTFALSILTSLLLFNLRISEGGDDSTYIIRALNLLNDGTYPSYQGPIYPMFLSVIMSVAGMKLGFLKLTSLLFMGLFFYLFYKAFKNRIEPVILYTVLLLLSVNSYVLYFSSQTYSEAMFMALLALFFVFIFKFLDLQKEGMPSIKQFLLIAFTLVLLVLTKTIGIGIVIAVILFFLIEKEYVVAGKILLAFTLILGGWMLLKGAIWGFDISTSNQASTLLLKNPYDASKGQETFWGYVTRFIDNSNLYLSKHFFKMIGMRSSETLSVMPALTVLLYVLFVYSFVEVFRRNRYLTFLLKTSTNE